MRLSPELFHSTLLDRNTTWRSSLAILYVYPSAVQLRGSQVPAFFIVLSSVMAAYMKCDRSSINQMFVLSYSHRENIIRCESSWLLLLVRFRQRSIAGTLPSLT